MVSKQPCALGYENDPRCTEMDKYFVGDEYKRKVLEVGGLSLHSRLSDWLRGPSHRLSSVECDLTHSNNAVKSANPRWR